ncbi:MAG: single-stranded DNA-binding protein [Xanthobacteraceae bacterium]|jgi:single-stranded DNA-binding protein
MSAIEVALFGTLGRDAEHKTSAKGKAYLRANIAVSQGEETTWVNAMVFDVAAIDDAAKFIKGARVYLEGRLQLSEWTDRDGKQRHGLSVMSWHCRLSQIGRSRPERDRKPPPAGRTKFTTAKPAASSSASNGAELNDDIPF